MSIFTGIFVTWYQLITTSNILEPLTWLLNVEFDRVFYNFIYKKLYFVVCLAFAERPTADLRMRSWHSFRIFFRIFFPKIFFEKLKKNNLEWRTSTQYYDITQSLFSTFPSFKKKIPYLTILLAWDVLVQHSQTAQYHRSQESGLLKN